MSVLVCVTTRGEGGEAPRHQASRQAKAGGRQGLQVSCVCVCVQANRREEGLYLAAGAHKATHVLHNTQDIELHLLAKVQLLAHISHGHFLQLTREGERERVGGHQQRGKQHKARRGEVIHTMLRARSMG